MIANINPVVGYADDSQNLSSTKTRPVFPGFGFEEEEEKFQLQNAPTVTRIESPSLEKFKTSNDIDEFQFI